jgi:nucleoside 2-deoxyribosyltransferase
MIESGEKAGAEHFAVFVGGPIQWAIDRRGSFDPRIRDVLQSVITHLRSRDAVVFSAHVEERFGAVPDLKPCEVARRDFQWMCRSDVYLAVLPRNGDGSSVRSDGTYIEIGWASALRKPILVLMEGLRAGAHRGSQLLEGLGCVAQVAMVDLSDALRSEEVLWEQIDALRFSIPKSVSA